jgi:hypothetical protein
VGRGGGGGIWPSRAQGPRERAVAPAQLWPKAGDGAGARGGRRLRGAHMPERAEGGGGTVPAVDGGVNQPSAWENPAAGGLGGDSPPVTRFLGNG